MKELKQWKKVPHKSVWWCPTILRLAAKKKRIKKPEENTRGSFTLTNQPSESMVDLMKKLKSPSNCLISALPTSGITRFSLTKSLTKKIILRLLCCFHVSLVLQFFYKSDRFMPGQVKETHTHLKQ